MNLLDLHDDVLVRVLESTSATDVTSLKRVSKRLHSVIENNRIGRPDVKELSIEYRECPIRSAPFGKFQSGKVTKTRKRMLVQMRRSVKGRERSSTQEHEDVMETHERVEDFIHETLQQVRIAERLSFDGLIVDPTFLNMIRQKKHLSDVKSLYLTLCRMAVDETQMSSLLSQMKLESLSLDFCVFYAHSLTDKVLLSSPELKVLRVQPRSTVMFTGLTNKTLEMWALHRPHTIQLSNTITSFTLEAVQALIELLPKDATIDWELGMLQPSSQTDAAMASLWRLHGYSIQSFDVGACRRVVCTRNSVKVVFDLMKDAISA